MNLAGAFGSRFFVWAWSVSYSMVKQVWHQISDDASVRFDIINWSNGVYFVTLQHDEAVSSVLLVVQH
jgi:hypothetical protein